MAQEAGQAGAYSWNDRAHGSSEVVCRPYEAHDLDVKENGVLNGDGAYLIDMITAVDPEAKRLKLILEGMDGDAVRKYIATFFEHSKMFNKRISAMLDRFKFNDVAERNF